MSIPHGNIAHHGRKVLNNQQSWTTLDEMRSCYEGHWRGRWAVYSLPEFDEIGRVSLLGLFEGTFDNVLSRAMKFSHFHYGQMYGKILPIEFEGV